MTKSKKQRLIDFPEHHPALDSRVPQFRFADGTAEPTSRAALEDTEQNQILVRQLVDMFDHLKTQATNEKITRQEHKESKELREPMFKEKGTIPPPL